MLHKTNKQLNGRGGHEEFPGRQVKICRCALWLAAVESFDLRFNLQFKIVGAEVSVGDLKLIGSCDLLESEPKLRNIPNMYNLYMCHCFKKMLTCENLIRVRVT